MWGPGSGPWLLRTPCSATAAGFRICRTGVRTTSRVLERMEHVHLQGPTGLTGGVGCAKWPPGGESEARSSLVPSTSGKICLLSFSQDACYDSHAGGDSMSPLYPARPHPQKTQYKENRPRILLCFHALIQSCLL